MKGFLKGSDGGVFHLLPKLTTIGRDGCNLAVQSPSVDSQHAVIEFNEQKDWFVLQDLDTTQGTSVNQCRIQNAAVRLSPGDVIKFGGHPTTYEFNISSQSQMARPPAYPRAAWSSCSKVMETTSSLCGQKLSLPNQPSSGLSVPVLWPKVGEEGSTGGSISPHPPTTTKARPVSAGVRRSSLDVASPVVQIQNPVDSEVRLPVTQNSFGKSGSQLEQLQQHLRVLTEELKSLAGIEMNARQKDALISQLRDEIASLQKRLRHVEAGVVDPGSSDVKQKLIQLEKEMVRSQMETKSLKSQLNQMKPAVSVTTSPYHLNCTKPLASSTSTALKSQVVKPKQSVVISEKEQPTDVNRLLTEIDHMKKDKNVTVGLLSHLQKDMANKDVSILHLTKQIEELKKEVSVKDCHISSLKSKVQHVDQPKKDEGVIDFKDREMSLLQYRLKLSESQRLELTEQLMSAKKELTEAKVAAAKDKQQVNKAKSDSETLSSKYEDMERAERLVRVALEQVSKKLELLRSQVIQTAYSFPGAKIPDRHMDDDEVLAALKGYISQHAELLKKNQLLEGKRDIENIIAENTRKLQKEFVDTVVRLKSKGQQSRHLQEEVDRIKAIPVTETFLSDVKDAFVMLLQSRVNWEKDIENSLEKSGVQLTLLSDVPGKCIADLHSKLQEALAEGADLKNRLEEADSRYKDQLNAALGHLRTDLEISHKDDIERIRHEDELRLVHAVNEAHRSNEGAIESAVDMEKQKNTELEKKVELLKQQLKEMGNSCESLRVQAVATNDSLELFKRTEADLRDSLKKLESDQSDRVNQLIGELKECKEELKERVRERGETDEQAKQHRSMICALEERLNVAVNKNKEHQAEIARLIETVSELEGKSVEPQITPPPEPKPSMPHPVAEEAAMEQLLQDNRELSRRLQDQQNIIVALRRDLAGAQARLSDLTAELSDAQKMALEKGNEKIRTQEAELTQLQQKMARLSEIVDKQTIEIKDLKSSLSKETEMASQYKRDLDKISADLSNLQKVKEKKRTTSGDLKEIEKDKVLSAKDKGQSELQSIGAQCKGDRHVQVIERQREALVELRARLKAPNGGSATAEPTASSLDHALQQVVVLQKEFEGLRANQPPSSVSAPKDKEEPTTVVDQVDNRTQMIDFASRAQLDMEKSAHFETQSSLERSEETYMALVRLLLRILNVERDTDLRSMAHLSLEDSQHLAGEREKIHQSIADQIEALKKRLERKDELLKGFDGGLSQIREAQDFATINSQRAESLNDEIRELKEEVQCLQETLGRMREQLEKEKRLNAYIKQKKTFHLEREFSVKNGWPRHYCLQEEPMTKSKKKVFRVSSPKKLETKSLKVEGSKFNSVLANNDFKLIAVDT